MSKRRLSENQKRRIQLHQQRKQEQALEQEHVDITTLSHSQQIGRIIAHYGRSADVIAENHQIYSCDIRQNLPALVTGDNVVFELTATASGIIAALLPRISLLSRNIASGELRAMAANVTQVFVVIAPEPEVNWLVLDRYLVGLEQCQLAAGIVLNKSDLFGTKHLEEMLTIYKKIGYPIFKTCTQQPETLTTLTAALVDQTSIFIGQSGVGKSSLIQVLLPHEHLRTGALSERTRLGSHTTSTTRLYTFPHGGYLIDSPGIRDFGLNSIELRDLARGFIEFQPHLGHCKFKSCHHLNEPECAIHQAVEQGDITAQRLASYQELFHNLQEMAKDYAKNNST